MLKHRTLEVPNAFLQPTKLDQSIMQENSPQMNIIAYIKLPLIHIQIEIDWEGGFSLH